MELRSSKGNIIEVANGAAGHTLIRPPPGAQRRLTMRLNALLVLVACLVCGVAFGHTQEWYVDNMEAAKAKQAECLHRLKAGETLTKEEIAECQRASGALLRAGTFVKSQPRHW